MGKKHQTGALLRCADAGVPLPDLRAAMFDVYTEPDGRLHSDQCWAIRDVPAGQVSFATIVEHSRSRAEQALGSRCTCHCADSITGEARAYLRAVDLPVRMLRETRAHLDRGDLPTALTTRAHLRQLLLLQPADAQVPLHPADAAFLADLETSTDRQLDRALHALPGATSAERLVSLADFARRCYDTIQALPVPAGVRRLTTALAGRLAVSSVRWTLTGTPITTAALDAAISRQMLRGERQFYAQLAEHLATLTPRQMPAATGPDDAHHAAAFTCASSLDVTFNGMSGLALGIALFGSEHALSCVSVGIPVQRWGRRPGVLIAPAGVTAAAAELAQRAPDDVVADLGPVTVAEVAPAGGAPDWLPTLMRLWQGGGTGVLTDPRNAFIAARGIHAAG